MQLIIVCDNYIWIETQEVVVFLHICKLSDILSWNIRIILGGSSFTGRILNHIIFLKTNNSIIKLFISIIFLSGNYSKRKKPQ